MRTKLLKELRREAKNMIFIVPISGDVNRCVIKSCKIEDGKYGKYTTSVRSTYYFTDEIGQDREENYIPSILRYKTKNHFYRPYTFDQAVKKLDQLRQEYVIETAREMRMTWMKPREKFMTWFLKYTI